MRAAAFLLGLRRTERASDRTWDHVAFYYDELPAGTYDFYFRTRATTPGSFVQPSAFAEMMYDSAVFGQSAGARVKIERTEE